MKKLLFLDRDGCLIREPDDFQVDSLEKLELMPDVIPSLQKLKEYGFLFIMVTNQDGVGTKNFPDDCFQIPHEKMLSWFDEAGIRFERIFICPHVESDACECRKPLVSSDISSFLEACSPVDTRSSWMIGDRETDMIFAKNIQVKGLRIHSGYGWPQITQDILKTLS